MNYKLSWPISLNLSKVEYFVVYDSLCLYQIVWTFLNCLDLTRTGLPFSVFKTFLTLMFMVLNQLLSLLTRKLLYSVGLTKFVVILYFVFDFFFEIIWEDFDTFSSWNSVGKWFRHVQNIWKSMNISKSISKDSWPKQL